MLVAYCFAILCFVLSLSTDNPIPHQYLSLVAASASSSLMPSCISCYRHFAREGILNSHLAQSNKCKWVLERRQATEAAPTQTYDYEDDLESDPAMSEGGDNHANSPAPSDFGGLELPDFAGFDEFEAIPIHIDEDQPDAENLDQNTPEDDIAHANKELDRRARVEDALDEEPVATKSFPGAGGIVGHTAVPQNAYAADPNPYHPFANKTDWEMAWWAKKRGPGQTAFNDLLEVEGVGRLRTQYDRLLMKVLNR